DPAKLDRARYQAYEQFLFDNKLIKSITPVERYATGIE
ncbi:thiamine biosynthesis protein, partial [Pantoea agglomerans]|nr:thiamine biosynthesis protein [Pantoea agglomerans]